MIGEFQDEFKLYAHHYLNQEVDQDLEVDQVEIHYHEMNHTIGHQYQE